MKTDSGRRFAKAAALVGAGAIGATIVTGVAFAADPTPTPSASASAESHRGDRGGPGGHGPRGGMMGGFDGKVLHGDATVENSDGTTSVMRVVRGEVTAVSDTAITVKSSDGFTQTYAINADTDIHVGRDDAGTAEIQVGYQAMVAGTVSGDTATATKIGAMSPQDAAEMEQRMADRRAEMEQRMNDRDSDDTTSPSAPTQS